MSELQDIAESVSTVASEIAGVVQQLNAQAVRNRRTATQANATLAGSSDPRPKQVIQQLDTAAQQCEKAAQALQHAEQAANQFVGRIVEGGAGTEGSPRFAEAGSGGGGIATFLAVAMATKEGRGVAFFGSDDAVMRQSAHLTPDYPGEFVADLHGEPNRVGVTQGGSTTHLSAQEFAQVLRQIGWQGQPVRLFSCNTGCDPQGFAQELANELGVTVTAPTAPVWTSGYVGEGVYRMGRFYPTAPPGRWAVFTPNRPV